MEKINAEVERESLIKSIRCNMKQCRERLDTMIGSDSMDLRDVDSIMDMVLDSFSGVKKFRNRLENLALDISAAEKIGAIKRAIDENLKNLADNSGALINSTDDAAIRKWVTYLPQIAAKISRDLTEKNRLEQVIQGHKEVI